MKEINQAIRRFNQSMNDDDIEEISMGIEVHNFSSGDYLIREGQIANSLFFIINGGVKCYSPSEARVLWAEFENEFVTIPISYFSQTPSKEELICLEDTTVWIIKYKDLENLYRTNLKWSNWGRNIAEYWIGVFEITYKVLRIKSGTERYEKIQELRPDILQRASLKDISSFLGISQVSISRIRANKQVGSRKQK